MNDHANLETLNLSTWRWEIRATYPYSSSIWYHANLIHNNRFVVFGGSGGGQTIAAYDYSTNSWQKLGDLVNGRSEHAVIATQGAFLVVGNDINGGTKTEKCTLNGNTMTCIEQDPVIRSVEYYFYFQSFYLFYSTNNYCLHDAFQCCLELLHMKTQKLTDS